MNGNKIEKNKKEIEKFESELQKYQEEIENLENENQKNEKELDIYVYKNLVNAVNTMNLFYENEQKNNKIMEEIKLNKEKINQLKLKEHVMKYIQESKDDIEDIDKNENKENENGENNLQKEEISSDLFNGLNLNNNNEMEKNNNEDDGAYTGFNLMENNDNEKNDINLENKIKELNEKIQNAVNVSI